jgi:hypothetical protein
MSSGTQQIRLIVMEFGRFTLGLGAGLALLPIMHQPDERRLHAAFERLLNYELGYLRLRIKRKPRDRAVRVLRKSNG